MSVSVEASRRKGKTDGAPFRQRWKPKALCVVDPTNPDQALSRIIPRIAENQRACGIASFLLINPETSQAFVLRADKPIAVEMERMATRSPYWPWLVGKYRFGRVAAEFVQAVLEDIGEHMGFEVEPAPEVYKPVQLDLFGAASRAA